MTTQTNTIIDMLKQLSASLNIAIDWSAENIVPYIQNLITRVGQYQFYYSTVILVVSIIGFIIGLCLLIKTCYNFKEKEFFDLYDFCEGANWIVALAAGIIFVMSLICIPTSINDIMEAKYLPEIATVKYIQKQIERNTEGGN